MKKIFLTATILLVSLSLFAQTDTLKPIRTKHFEYYSFYHTTRDDVRIAVDVFLPRQRATTEKVPTVFYLTRYVRTIELKKIVKGLQNPGFGQVHKGEVDFFTSHGYACVIVDARGSGASFGNRLMDFTLEEMKDGAEVMDWIIAQPWSNGKIGTTGISYLGTTSELLLLNQHPAVQACIPRSNIYDLYADISFPGGVRQGPFVKAWGKTTKSLDNNNFKVFGGAAASLVKGVNPVMGDKDRVLLQQAVEQHKQNYDVFNEILKIEYRDEEHPVLHKPIDDFSIQHHNQEIVDSRTPIFRIGGWYDGALSNSVIKGLWNNPNTRQVLIGPWDHGPGDDASPYSPDPKVDYPVFQDMLRFFDYHLKGVSNGTDTMPRVRYFTIGEERWHTADTWPPAGVTNMPLYFSADTSASWNPVGDGDVKVPLYYDAGSGGGSRWNSQTTIYKYEKHTGYPDRKKQTEMIFHFETAPLADTVTITGHIEAHLECSYPTEDGNVFIYVDEVDEKGNVRYVTEGMFRAIHRKVGQANGYKVPGAYHSFRQEDKMPLVPDERFSMSFALLPISYRVPKGHYLRISLTGIDPEHFDIPKIKPDYMHLFTGHSGSYLNIPVQR